MFVNEHEALVENSRIFISLSKAVCFQNIQGAQMSFDALKMRVVRRNKINRKKL